MTVGTLDRTIVMLPLADIAARITTRLAESRNGERAWLLGIIADADAGRVDANLADDLRDRLLPSMAGSHDVDEEAFVRLAAFLTKAPPIARGAVRFQLEAIEEAGSDAELAAPSRERLEQAILLGISPPVPNSALAV